MFEEIGLQFARYLETGEPAGLRRGDPPEGQRLLSQAFAHYERARQEDDPVRHAQLALLANLEIGLHEQTRLQPEILEALDAATTSQEDLGRRALDALFPAARRWWPSIRRVAAGVIGMPARAIQRAACRLSREVITDALMVLSLPGRVLALGANLGDEYPEELVEPADPDLVALLALFEPVPPALDDCGARDWSDFHQRMHYIVHLFRRVPSEPAALRFAVHAGADREHRPGPPPWRRALTPADYSRFVIASASSSKSTYCSPETSTTASLIVPPVNSYGCAPA